MKHLFKKYRIVKVRKIKPWKIQKRFKFFFWVDIDQNYETFDEAMTAALKIKNKGV